MKIKTSLICLAAVLSSGVAMADNTTLVNQDFYPGDDANIIVRNNGSLKFGSKYEITCNFTNVKERDVYLEFEGLSQTGIEDNKIIINGNTPFTLPSGAYNLDSNMTTTATIRYTNRDTGMAPILRIENLSTRKAGDHTVHAQCLAKEIPSG